MVLSQTFTYYELLKALTIIIIYVMLVNTGCCKSGETKNASAAPPSDAS